MTGRRTRAVLLALGVTTILLSGARPSAGDEGTGGAGRAARATDAQKKEAQALFSEGVKLTESGDLRGALASFRGAYERIPSFRVLYNIGQLCVRLNDSACAVLAYEQYLRDGGADVPARRRAEIDAEIQKLSRSVGTIKLAVNVAGAEVSVDDASVGRTPLAKPVPVNPGSHTIVVAHEGKTVDRTVEVTAGDAVSVEIEVPRDPAPGPIVVHVPSTEEPAPAAPPERRFPIVPWAVTGAFGAATVVTGILAAAAYSDFQERRDSFPVTREELDDAQGTARTLFLLAGLFGTITVVSASVAGYFTFLAPSPAKAPPSNVGLAAGPGGVYLRGLLP